MAPRGGPLPPLWGGAVPRGPRTRCVAGGGISRSRGRNGRRRAVGERRVHPARGLRCAGRRAGPGGGPARRLPGCLLRQVRERSAGDRGLPAARRFHHPLEETGEGRGACRRVDARDPVGHEPALLVGAAGVRGGAPGKRRNRVREGRDLAPRHGHGRPRRPDSPALECGFPHLADLPLLRRFRTEPLSVERGYRFRRLRSR